jgi:DNA-binding NarL/FixJ family response regulator
MTQVMIVDDQPNMRLGLSALLQTSPDLALCAAADCGETALELAAELRPDVVVMDLSMPGMGGIAATRQMRALCPAAQVMILTWYADAERVRLAFAAGATGYILKGDGRVDVLDCIREVALGRRCLSAALSDLWDA